MKNLITLIIGLLVVGCGKGGEITIGEPPKEEPAMSTDSIKALRDSVVGEYEGKDEDGDTFKLVLLENDVFEYYNNGKKREGDYKWSISEDGELHVIDEDGDIGVYRINKDGSLTLIARIQEGKREEAPKEYQFTAKKIK